MFCFPCPPYIRLPPCLIFLSALSKAERVNDAPSLQIECFLWLKSKTDIKHLMLQAWECVWHANMSWNDAGDTSRFGGSLSLTRTVTVFPRVPLSLTTLPSPHDTFLFYYINPKRVTKLNHLRMIAEYCVGRRSALRAVPLDTPLWFSQQKVTPDLGLRPASL